MKAGKLLKSPEGKTLEFKRDTSALKQIMRTIIAFANSAGGTLVIGREDNGDLTGVDDPLLMEEQLANSISDSIAPRLVPNIEIITVEEKTLLIVNGYPSSLRPHYLKTEGPDTSIFVRLGSTNRQADKALSNELRRSAEGVSFDSEPMPNLTLNDLDLESAQELFGNSRNLNTPVLLNLKLITKEQGRLVPTRGGVLLFGKNREFHFPDAWVQCGRFIGEDKSEIFDHIEIYDYLPKAVDSIMLFLKKHAMRGADLSDIRRKDIWSIPISILREAILNALVHTDYSQRGGPIRIAFFDNRIEVENPGILLPGMTIDDMKNGVSKIRNPVITRIFRELGQIEQWGSGVCRMFKEAKALGLPELEIIEIGIRLRLIIPIAEQHIVTTNQASKWAQVEAQVEAQVDKDILTICSNKPLSSSQIATALGHKTLSGNLRKALSRLKEAEFIEMTIPEKPQSNKQKYRLTVRGEQYLEQIDG